MLRGSSQHEELYLRVAALGRLRTPALNSEQELQLLYPLPTLAIFFLCFVLLEAVLRA